MAATSIGIRIDAGAAGEQLEAIGRMADRPGEQAAAIRAFDQPVEVRIAGRLAATRLVFTTDEPSTASIRVDFADGSPGGWLVLR